MAWRDSNIDLLAEVISQNVEERFTFSYFEITDVQFMQLIKASQNLRELSINYNKITHEEDRASSNRKSFAKENDELQISFKDVAFYNLLELDLSCNGFSHETLKEIYSDLAGTVEKRGHLAQLKKLELGGNTTKFNYSKMMKADDKLKEIQIDENYKKSKKDGKCYIF